MERMFSGLSALLIVWILIVNTQSEWWQLILYGIAFYTVFKTALSYGEEE